MVVTSVIDVAYGSWAMALPTMGHFYSSSDNRHAKYRVVANNRLEQVVKYGDALGEGAKLHSTYSRPFS